MAVDKIWERALEKARKSDAATGAKVLGTSVKNYEMGDDGKTPYKTSTPSVNIGSGFATPKVELPDVSSSTDPSFLDRLKNTVSGGLKGSGANSVNATGAMFQFGQGARDKANEDLLTEYNANLERAKRDLEAMRTANAEKAGSFSDRDLQSQMHVIEDWQRKYDAMNRVVTEKVQQKATTETYKLADQIQQSAEKDTAKAKEGASAVGATLVDVGTAGTQLLGDIATGAVTGVGTMPAIFIRGFGAGTQQARQNGATYEEQLAYGLGTATVEALTEKIASVGSIATKYVTKGALDDVAKGVIKAVEDHAKTKAGKVALNRLASIGAGFVGEGFEEAISAYADPIIQKLTYDKSGEKIDWEQVGKDAAYQFLIGGILGGVMGGFGGTDTSDVKIGKDTNVPINPETKEPTPVSAAASPEVHHVQAQAEVTQAQNPEAEVLDAATTLFTQQGMNLKTAQTRAEIVGKLVAGETVSDKDLNRIDPTSAQTKRIFTQLTGVQFPEGKIQIEELRNLYRSAHAVAEAAKVTLEEQEISEIQPMSDEQILERAKQARSAANPEAEAQAAQILAQARGEIAPDGNPMLNYKDFAARHKQVFPDASPQETARMYDRYLKENQTVSFMGRHMTRQQVLNTLNSAPGVERLTAEERAQIEADLNAKFDAELEAQKRDGKDAVEHSDRRRRTEVREKVQRSVNDWKKVLIKNSSVKDIVLDESLGENEAAFITPDGVVHLNAKRMTSEADVAYVLGHELVHSIDDSTARKTMVNDIIDTVRKITEPTESREDAIERYRKMYQEHENQVAERANREAKTISFEYAEEEYAADLMREVFLSGDMLNKLAAEKPSLMARIQEILQKWIASLKGNNEAVELYNELTALQDRFVKALQTDAAQQKLALENAGIQVDTETESARHNRFSLDTWLESDYMTDPENAAKALAKAIGVSDKKAAKYIKDVNGVAKLIADNKALLDYEAAPRRSSFVSNTEYGGSIDFSTICKKRRLFTGTFTAIQKALPNTALTSDEMIDIRKRMKDAGHEVSCGLCYVEGSRLNLGQYATEFLDKYTAEAHEFVPAISDLTTVDGQEELRREHPDVYEAYIGYLNTLAQRKPKVYQTATAYDGEILKKFGKDTKVEEKNKNGGLRLQSFSDFEIIHLIDNMQVIMDMARVGLAGQAYTKVPDFAWAMGNTGLKINLSLIAKDVDADGHLVFDDVEGMPHAEAKKLRDAYSDNVGTIIVVFNDAQLKAAMADDFIDYIIPFHRSQLNQKQYDGLGLPKGTKNYTMVQNESYIEPVLNKSGKKTRPDNYMPNTYWDFNKSGKENAEAYLKMCAENNRRPKFSNVLEYNGDGSYSLPADGSADGYWKLLIDFKMYNNDGVGVPQQPVKPDFNIDEANRMLSEYKGGHSNFPVAQDIVDEFVADYKKNHPDVRYSVTSMLAAGESDEKYWRPKIGPKEWSLINRRKHIEFDDPSFDIDETEKWLYANEKGTKVFAVYSKNDPSDPTVLYAAKGRMADKKHQQLLKFMEEYHGNHSDREDLNRVLEDLESQQGEERFSISDAGQRQTNAENVSVPVREPGSDRARNSGIRGENREDSVTIPASEKSGAFNLDDYDIEDLLKLSDAEFEKLYDALGIDLTIDDDILLEDDFDIEDIAEELDEEPEKIEILFRRKGLGSDYVAPEKQAVMTEKRIDERIHDSGASRPDYARKYITRISPRDFIDLTVTEKNLDRVNFDTRVTGDSGGTMGDWNYEQALRDSTEPPVLDVNIAAGQVIGHNGRHRMRALEMVGIESVEIEVALYDEDGYLKKYGAETIPDLAISSQFDTKTETHVFNVIPLNKSHRDEIMQNYGDKAHADAAVKYSIDSTGQLLTEDQQEYFKDSKVRDEKGNLMRVYHGTPNGGFTEFRMPDQLSTLMSAQGAGYYFTDKENAKQYTKAVNKQKTEGARKKLYEVYLNITNPLEIREWERTITPEQFKQVLRRGNREWFKTNWMAHYADGAKTENQQLSFEELLDKYTEKFFRNTGNWDSDILAEMTRAFEGGDETILKAMQEVFGADGVRYTDRHGDIWVAWSQNQIKNVSNKNPTSDPDIRYSITPAFEQWYKETYGEDVSTAHLKRRLKTTERRAAEAEHDLKAAELKNTIDSEMDLTAWMIHHTKKMREQKRALNTKLDEARKAKAEAVRTAVSETKVVERAKAEVQHDADRMAERRNAAKRLRVREDAYKQKVTEMKENQKLKRNAAKATLRDSKLAAKRRAEIEAEQGVVDTIRKNPKQRTTVEKLQETAQNLRTLGRTAYRNFVNQAAAIDAFSKRQAEGMRAGTLVNIVGGTASTVESTFKTGLVDRAGNRIGDSMSDVFLCWDEKHKKVNEGQQALLQDFMLHWHNIDRMSIVARAESALETFELNHEWLRDMDQKEFARLVAMTEKELEKNGQYEAQQLAFQYHKLLRDYIEAANKPIFADDKGNSVTAETSQRIVDQYLEEHPWLLEKANSIYEWWDRFMREWAVGDTISEAEYERMHTMYPHYVPTYRADKNGVGGANFVGAGGATVSKAVKKAKGSHSEVMNIEDSFSNIVSKIIRLNRVNELYMNIIDTAMLDNDGLFSDMAYFDWDSSWQSGVYGDALLDGELTETVDDAVTAGLEKVGSDYKLSGWMAGRKYTTFISEELYKSIGNVTGHLANDMEEGLLKAGNFLTSPMKTAITGINPSFAVRNLSRDLPTAIINSISGLNFPKYYAQAAKEISKNSDHWKTFQALGGTHATYYNDNQGYAKAMSRRQNPASWTVGKLGAFNEVTEAQTRFAEYLATIARLGDTYENRLQGIKNAAEVTVDFSRKGRYGKVINAWVPYWNPAVQGIDKTIRSVIDSPDGSAVWKQASKTLGRAALTTVLVEAVLYGVLEALDRDDEWEELNDRTKAAYYCIPLKDSKTFLKIPKNREWGAILGTPFMHMLEWANGRENPFENYIETSIEPNFLPPAIFRPDSGGGFTTDVIGFSQMNDLSKNEDFAGRTIVPYAYEQGTLSQQYDNETSNWSKRLGKLFNWSPMQIDYIIGDYFGDFGDMFIQATSEARKQGEQNLGEAALDILTSPFLADARYSNYAVNKYYDLTTELGKVVQDKKNQMGNDAAKDTIEYQTDKALDEMFGKQITELNRYVRDLPDGDEKDAVKEQIAQLAKDAIEFYEDSMAGKVNNPIRTAEYHAFSETVSKELIRMDAFSGDYKFTPTGNPSSKYTDPNDKNREYILTDEQKDYFKQLYREKYNEIFGDLIQSSKYKKKKDSEKAELLEDARDDVLDATKEEFFEWLDDTGVRSTKKQK